MRELAYQIVRPKLNKRLAVLKLSGFINAATLVEFEGVLDEILIEARKDVVIDCQGLDYVNSSGIGALLNYQQSFQGRGGDLVLIRTPRAIAVVLRNLGITRSLAILTDEQEALNYLERDEKGGRKWTDPETFLKTRHPAPNAASGQPRAVIPLFRNATRQGSHAILMIEPASDDFSDVLRLRYNGRKGKVTLVHDCVSALTRFDQVNPDVIVLRDSLPHAEEFLTKVTSARGKSLTSVIRIYEQGRPPQQREFRVRENDAFQEPFEIGELFALADLELRRVPKCRSEISHMTSFETVTTPANLARAHTLARALIAASGLGEDAAAGYLAALKEALDNAARHAHMGGPGKRCTVHFLLDTEKATFIVQDEGPGFDHAFYTAQLADEDAYVRARRARAEGKQGGLGILLMHKNCDRLAYEGNGSILRLEKKLSSA
jgi:anti-anti-sigma factor